MRFFFNLLYLINCSYESTNFHEQLDDDNCEYILGLDNYPWDCCQYGENCTSSEPCDCQLEELIELLPFQNPDYINCFLSLKILLKYDISLEVINANYNFIITIGRKFSHECYRFKTYPVTHLLKFFNFNNYFSIGIKIFLPEDSIVTFNIYNKHANCNKSRKNIFFYDHFCNFSKIELY
ncbi:hypothetical protein NUSPORA_00159 [Nucleospora cyclopteri]